MPPDHSKIKAAKLAQSKHFQSQTVTINPDWKILRVDDRNWEIQFQGNFKGYYSSLLNALGSLPGKMLDQHASGTLADVLQTHNAIKATIKNALQHHPDQTSQK